MTRRIKKEPESLMPLAKSLDIDAKTTQTRMVIFMPSAAIIRQHANETES